MKTKGSRNKKGVKRILTVHGYYEIFQPQHPLAKKNGYIREHRMIAWDAGILTDPSLEVHHKNEIKTDNRIENLEVTTHAEHTSKHWKGSIRPKWSNERRKAKSEAMKGNHNWCGNIYENHELFTPPTNL